MLGRATKNKGMLMSDSDIQTYIKFMDFVGVPQRCSSSQTGGREIEEGSRFRLPDRVRRIFNEAVLEYLHSNI